MGGGGLLYWKGSISCYYAVTLLQLEGSPDPGYQFQLSIQIKPQPLGTAAPLHYLACLRALCRGSHEHKIKESG